MIENSPIVAAYRARTPGSAALAERARRVFPSGITHDGRGLLPHVPYIVRAEGSRKWDVDGNEYVDYWGGHGALLLGHGDARIASAVAGALAAGTHFGSSHEWEVAWGERVQQLVPSAERVRFTASGTEAGLLAIRLARAFTGRNRIVQLIGHFHGWHDQTIAAFDAGFSGTPPRGVPAGMIADTLYAAPRDLPAIERLLTTRDDIAAVLLEPTGASWGMIPFAADFVQRVRDLTRERRVLLIFDEVITGFRVSPGGAQAALGILPDLTMLAKIVAGGMPGGAVAGRKDILDLLDFEEARQAGTEKIEHHGTFNANPVTAAAGAEMLSVIARTDACARASARAGELRRRLNDVLEAERVGWSVYGLASSFYVFLNPDGIPLDPHAFDPLATDWRAFKRRPPEIARKLKLALLVHGVDLSGSLGGMVSAAHTDDDVRRTADALARSVRMLRDEGISLPPAG
jgi:glutamate-1-semialdehyde 2,1-aminomutase